MSIRKLVIILTVAMAVGFALSVGAQVLVQPLQLADIRSFGTGLGIFSKPNLKYLNFKKGASYNSSTGAVDICTDCVAVDGGIGTAIPKGFIMGSTAARPTCASGIRGRLYTLQSTNAGTDAGTPAADKTYQCMQNSDATYSWIQIVTGG